MEWSGTGHSVADGSAATMSGQNVCSPAVSRGVGQLSVLLLGPPYSEEAIG